MYKHLKFNYKCKGIKINNNNKVPGKRAGMHNAGISV
jgi:hypothetical protein